ncbi:unnamed protein product [Acanthoscelides obtectus]|uniref:Uncharacterized protein n=1 Tax=Acanthoscelides obtectus TaxID=200917 RepID=A0A9P0PN96_ACAOB|nr:unnamed protein product [Acanthoscelides obtectus]CAK1663192.1 hypothetical protein AOBTE_LOCUS23541 [Acanthoscelides obtectus]
MGHLFLPEETNNPAEIILGLGNYPDSCIDGNRALEFDAQRNKPVIYASPSRSIAKNDGETSNPHFILSEVKFPSEKGRKPCSFFSRCAHVKRLCYPICFPGSVQSLADPNWDNLTAMPCGLLEAWQPEG